MNKENQNENMFAFIQKMLNTIFLSIIFTHKQFVYCHNAEAKRDELFVYNQPI